MPEGHGIDRLRKSQTLDDVLKTAMSFEQTARDFYSDLSRKVSKPLRALVEELAEEEKVHFDMFEELMQRDDLHASIQTRIKTPKNDHAFSNYIHTPDLGEHPDDQAVLQYALGREHAAMEQYLALASEAPDGPIQDLFAWLAQEELEHKAELEKRYYALTYPSNV